MGKITVIDSPVGTGKTSYMIDRMNNSISDNRQILYITPFLKEVDRIIKSCPDRNFVQPEAQKGGGSKMRHLISLIHRGANVVSTHALLQNITDELLEAFVSNNYTLVLDEAFQVLEAYDLYSEKRLSNDERERLTKDDIRWLLDEEYISVGEDSLVSWTGKTVGHKYEPLKSSIDRGLIYMVRDSLFLWTFPIEIFSDGIFEEIYVLTYMWEAQYQYHYYRYFGVDYEKFHIIKKNGKYTLEETVDNDYELEWKRNATKLVTIVDNPNLNKIGSVYTDARKRVQKGMLSLNWYQNASPESIRRLKSNMDNFFRNVSGSKANDRLWCTFKEFSKKLTSKGANISSWLEITSRATNDYRSKSVLAYMVNRYPHVYYEEFFRQRNVIIDREAFAVSDLVQWIWRSCIRDGKPITVYIPSERMRSLFIKFLNNEKLEF